MIDIEKVVPPVHRQRVFNRTGESFISTGGKEMKSGNVNQRRIKKWLYVFVIFVFLYISVGWLSPVVFACDGLLTRMRVEDYKTQYDLGSTRRHDADVTDIYLFNFGFERVFVQKEEKNGEVFEGYDIEVKKLLPFLYKWERQPNDPAYRVTIGEKKYYYTIVSC